ncbi:hypothetical protein GCM10020256_56650 [Streptomyces thermocoprophilus]
MRQELVARQLDEQIAGRFPVGQRLRVLDVGMGQGTQALRLARAGHKVTGLEQDATMIAVAREALAQEPEGIRERMRIMEGDGRETGVHFLPGSFDVVLCHGVLMYVEEPDPLLAGLARVLAPGGLLSLLVRNGDALAMRPGLYGDWAGALTAFDTTAYRNRLGLDVRADRREALTATLAGIGAPAARLVRRTGLHGHRGGRRPPSPTTSTRCWRWRRGPGGPTRTGVWRRCCTCAGCAAERRTTVSPGRVSCAGRSLAGR